VALSMDEQRILDEMERKLADDDPRLASRLASFAGPGLGIALRSPQARLLASLAALAMVAVVALMVYSMIPFRAGAGRQQQAHHFATTPGVTRSVAAPASIGPAPAQTAQKVRAAQRARTVQSAQRAR
jgi:hypothetical protein